MRWCTNSEKAGEAGEAGEERRYLCVSFKLNGEGGLNHSNKKVLKEDPHTGTWFAGWVLNHIHKKFLNKKPEAQERGMAPRSLDGR